eukprot:6174997-Pleurochrysis_carterae.AAC.1
MQLTPRSQCIASGRRSVTKHSTAEAVPQAVRRARSIRRVEGGLGERAPEASACPSSLPRAEALTRLAVGSGSRQCFPPRPVWGNRKGGIGP